MSIWSVARSWSHELMTPWLDGHWERAGSSQRQCSTWGLWSSSLISGPYSQCTTSARRGENVLGGHWAKPCARCNVVFHAQKYKIR